MNTRNILYFLFLFFLGCLLLASCQNQNSPVTNSEYQELYDSIKSDAMKEFRGDFDKGIVLLDSLSGVTKLMENDSLILAVALTKDVLFISHRKYKEAIAFNDSFFLHTPRLKKIPFIKRMLLLNSANCYHHLQELEKSEEIYLGLLRERNLAKFDSVKIYSNLGGLHTTKKQYDVALAYLMLTDSIIGNDPKYNADKKFIEASLSSLYFNLGDFENAIFFYKKQLASSLDIEKPFLFNTIGGGYTMIDSFELASSMLDSALFYNKEANSEMEGVTYLRYAQLSLRKKEIQEAYLNVNKSYNILSQLDNSFYYLPCAKELMGVQLLLEDFDGIKELIVEIKEKDFKYLSEKDSVNIAKHKFLADISNDVPIKEYRKIFQYIDDQRVYQENQLNKQIHENHEKFAAKEKDLQNTVLRKDNELKEQMVYQARFRNWMTIGFSSLIVGLISWFLWKFSQKNKMIETFRKAESHRTKNNYRRVLDAMEDQANLIEDNETLVVINKGRSLIQTSAVLHSMLKANEEEGTNLIPIGKYLTELSDNLIDIFFEEEAVKLITNFETEIKIKKNTVQPLFLIIEELITNSWKHAFVNQKNPEIKISMKKIGGDRIRLSYQDNGKGLTENIDFSNDGAEGLEIIRLFTKNLGGKLFVENKDGMEINFDFEKLIQNS